MLSLIDGQRCSVVDGGRRFVTVTMLVFALAKVLGFVSGVRRQEVSGGVISDDVRRCG